MLESILTGIKEKINGLFSWNTIEELQDVKFIEEKINTKDLNCPICGEEFNENHPPGCKCSKCSTPYHQDCWDYNEGCGIFGCKQASGIKPEIITLIGKLSETYRQLDSNSIQHADEITKARLTNKDLRNEWFWTADSAMYTVEKENGKNDVFLYFGKRETNLVFKNIDSTIVPLIKNDRYFPSAQDIKLVKDSVQKGDTLRIKLSDLNLQSDECGCFTIKTSDYTALNPTQRAFAERVYSHGTDFDSAMKMLADANIASTKIFVVPPGDIKSVLGYVKSPLSSTVVRKAFLDGCCLSGFGNNSNFYAGDQFVDKDVNCLRGVSRK